MEFDFKWSLTLYGLKNHVSHPVWSRRDKWNKPKPIFVLRKSAKFAIHVLYFYPHPWRKIPQSSERFRVSSMEKARFKSRPSHRPAWCWNISDICQTLKIFSNWNARFTTCSFIVRIFVYVPKCTMSSAICLLVCSKRSMYMTDRRGFHTFPNNFLDTCQRVLLPRVNPNGTGDFQLSIAPRIRVTNPRSR